MDELVSFGPRGQRRTRAEEIAAAVSEGLVRQRELELLYRKLDGKKHELRRIQPLYLQALGETLFLFALDPQSNDGKVRSFVLSRMKNVRVTSRGFVHQHLAVTHSARQSADGFPESKKNVHPLSQNGTLHRQPRCMSQNIDPTARLDPWKAAPDVYKAALALETSVRSFGIEPKLLELIKLRASQINGCAHCMDIHFNDAVKAGELLQRLNLLPVWSETPYLYTAAERAVLRWTEALTNLPGHHVTDEDFAEISLHFNEAELTRITLAIATINAWNRFGTAFRTPVSSI